MIIKKSAKYDCESSFIVRFAPSYYLRYNSGKLEVVVLSDKKITKNYLVGWGKCCNFADLFNL